MKLILRLTILGLCFAISTTVVWANEPLKFDEFGSIPCAEELDRLDAYGSRLRVVPAALAVVVVYGGRHDTKQGEVAARLVAVKNHLMKRNAIDSSRIITLDGGYRERMLIQLWMTPSEARSSATLLVPPEASLKNVHLKGPGIRKWEYKCRRKLN